VYHTEFISDNTPPSPSIGSSVPSSDRRTAIVCIKASDELRYYRASIGGSVVSDSGGPGGEMGEYKSTRVMIGSSLVKVRHLISLGWKVVPVWLSEWSDMKSDKDRAEYMIQQSTRAYALGPTPDDDGYYMGVGVVVRLMVALIVMAIRRRESSPTLTTTDDDDECNVTPWAKRRRKAATITSPPSIALLQHHQFMHGKVSDNSSDDDDDDTRCDDTHVIVSTTTTSDEGSSRESNDGMHDGLGEERYSDTMVIAAKTAEGQHTSSSRRYSIVLPSIHDDPHEECVVEAEVILPHHHPAALLLPQYPDHCPSEQRGQHRVGYIDDEEVTTQVDIDHAGDDGHNDGYEYHGDEDDDDDDDDTPPLVVNLHLVAHPHQKYEIRISPSGDVEYTIQPRPLMSELKDVMSTIVGKLRSILIPNRVCEKAEHDDDDDDDDDDDVDKKASSSLMIAGDGHEALPAAILDSHHHLPVGMPIALESFHNIPALPPSSSSSSSSLPLPSPFTHDSSSEGSSSSSSSVNDDDDDKQ
ncbi:hypothetical protein FOZ61_000967, partial [Perkinsus olseni]